MTVKELINELKKYDENTEVKMYASYDCGHCWAGGEIEMVDFTDGRVELINEAD